MRSREAVDGDVRRESRCQRGETGGGHGRGGVGVDEENGDMASRRSRDRGKR